MEVVQVPIDLIKPYWRNPRRNQDDAVQAVKRSIEKYGFNVPLVLDMEGVIIAGHTRYKAALELGLKDLPCHYSDMGPKKAKEYRIADNKTAEIASWDVNALKLEMRELDLLDALPGFSDSEMNALVKDIDFGGEPAAFTAEGALGAMPVVGAGSMTRPSMPVSEKDRERFDRKEAELTHRFEETSKEVQDNYVQVMCPHCAQEFVIDKREMGC